MDPRRRCELIARTPEVRAGDLAAELGQERLPFKANVRKLKALGLTESLEVGYRLSPRGRAYPRPADVRHPSRVGPDPWGSCAPRPADTPPRGDPANQLRQEQELRMINRWMAVVLGAAVLAVPGTALAKGDHAKRHKATEKSHSKATSTARSSKKDKAAKKAKTYVFKGVYKGDGVVTVASGNSRVRKGGYVGKDVTFDLLAAKLVVADTDGVPGVTAADVQAGDKVLVQARLPRGTKAPGRGPQPRQHGRGRSPRSPSPRRRPPRIKARKLVDLTHPPVRRRRRGGGRARRGSADADHRARRGDAAARHRAGRCRSRPRRAPRARAALSSREVRASGSQATSTLRPSAATVPSEQLDPLLDRHALARRRWSTRETTSTQPWSRADLGAVVELDVHEHERERVLLEAGEQGAAALLEQLVVDGLVDVAEQVQVAPADRDPDPALAGFRHGARQPSGGRTSTAPPRARDARRRSAWRSTGATGSPTRANAARAPRGGEQRGHGADHQPRPRPERRPASQPTNGAPIGVEPRNTTEYSAITRPRIAGSTASCSVEFTPAAKVTVTIPSGTSAAICSGSVGAAAAASISTPNAAAAHTSSRESTRPRAPAASAPSTEPTPIEVVSSA